MAIDNCWAWWKFSGDANDDSGNNRNLTSYGTPSYGIDYNGDSNEAVIFNGTDQYFFLSGEPGPAGSFSVAVIARLDDISDRQMIICNYGSTGSCEDFIINHRGDQDQVLFTVFDDTELVSAPISISANELTNNKWYLFLLVYDNSTGTINAYVYNHNEGIDLHESATNSNLNYSNPDTDLCVGRQSNIDSYHLDGAIAEIRIYDRALDSTEIYNLKNYVWPVSFVISGTLKEKESDVAGSQYDFAIIKTDFVTPAFTIIDATESAADGAFAVDVDDDTTQHFELRLDDSGTYPPKIRDQLTGSEVDTDAGTSYTEPAYTAGSGSYSGRHLIADGSGADGFYAVAFHYPSRNIANFCYATYDICDSNGDFDLTGLALGIYVIAIIDPDGYEPYVYEITVD